MTMKPVVLTVGVSPQLGARLRHVMRTRSEFLLMEAESEAEAVSILHDVRPGVVLVNADLDRGCPLSVADYVCYRCPNARVVFEMGEKTGFVDGSLFAHSVNAHAIVTPGMPTDDVGAVVAHHATKREAA